MRNNCSLEYSCNCRKEIANRWEVEVSFIKCNIVSKFEEYRDSISWFFRANCFVSCPHKYSRNIAPEFCEIFLFCARISKESRINSNICALCLGSTRNRSSSPYRQREVSSGSVRSGGSGGAQVNLGYGTNAWADSRRASSSVSQVTGSFSLSLYHIMLVPGLPRSRNFFLDHAVTLHAPVVLRVSRNFSPERRKQATGTLSIFMTQRIYTWLQLEIAICHLSSVAVITMKWSSCKQKA